MEHIMGKKNCPFKCIWSPFFPSFLAARFWMHTKNCRCCERAKDPRNFHRANYSISRDPWHRNSPLARFEDEKRPTLGILHWLWEAPTVSPGFCGFSHPWVISEAETNANFFYGKKQQHMYLCCSPSCGPSLSNVFLARHFECVIDQEAWRVSSFFYELFGLPPDSCRGVPWTLTNCCKIIKLTPTGVGRGCGNHDVTFSLPRILHFGVLIYVCLLLRRRSLLVLTSNCTTWLSLLVIYYQESIFTVMLIRFFSFLGLFFFDNMAMKRLLGSNATKGRDKHGMLCYMVYF